MASISVERDVIAQLFHLHRDDIVNFLWQRVRCLDVAQDLSQETYLRLLKKDALAHTDNLSGYLFRTAERLAIDFLRQDKRVGSRLDELTEELVCPQLLPEALTILRQQCQLLLEAIAALPPSQRHVLLLRKVDQLSYADIAAKLRISEKTVQRHLVQAMLHCHRRLDAY